MFWWRERVDPDDELYGVEWAVTDRVGGASRGPWSGLNLGSHVGDAPADVATNRQRLARSLEVPVDALRFMDQQHGTQVVQVRGDHGRTEQPVAAPACDALVTDTPDVVLLALVADCTPVLIVDRVAGLAAAVHAGRKGLVAAVVPVTLARMRALGAADLQAVVGPSICGRCYEVSAPMRAEAGEVSAAAHSVSWAGTPAIDVAAGVVEQLAAEGVPCRWLGGCAREVEDLYSYRRDGRTGRYAGVVRLLAPHRAA
ncbi:MAG: peptidoglycan editing factor PgeF [Ornithinimicrobium sp.]|uniref:peptidoglycan editing factor PgeF n=1 Tax=Ornithinimicrobium sp. TaxID=1977084 RepID=UPI003D9BED40